MVDRLQINETGIIFINLSQALILLVMVLFTFKKEFAFLTFRAENLQPLPVTQFTDGETDVIAFD